ncbi:STAS domain-containing protein [Colwellia sp. RSH04]|uniref:STAS domain-containing protein n=1 Tax=Colwellia sp. RSH04 TaxID=2305464 RepID=UPI000E56C830|nr:STAS domain-containing protein [Colwellia sp. RSH04]RHW77093.1 anti-sigma factor antagonist [Colwellia sp. RSH04]
MTVKSTVKTEENKVIISVDDRFDFSLHQQFRDSYSEINNKGQEYILDLSNTKYMDSSALGMILLLKDHVEMNASTLTISNPSDTVSKILEIAQFHRLMTIK